MWTCAIRPHVVFGPGDTRLLPAILGRAREGKLKFRVGLGEKKLSDFTYVTNVVDAMLAADERLVPGSPVAGQAYFITNGEPMSFWDFVGQVLPPLGHKPPRFAIPRSIAYAAAAVREAYDTYVRGGDGRWGEPSRLPEPVHSPASELLPRPQPDGSLLFCSSRPGGHEQEPQP